MWFIWILDGPVLKQINALKFQLTVLTFKNARDTILSLPTGNVSFAELKAVVPNTDEEQDVIMSTFPGTPPTASNWVVDTVMAGFFLQIADIQLNGTVSITPHEANVICSRQDSKNLFAKQCGKDGDYVVWSKIEKILVPLNLEG